MTTQRLAADKAEVLYLPASTKPRLTADKAEVLYVPATSKPRLTALKAEVLYKFAPTYTISATTMAVNISLIAATPAYNSNNHYTVSAATMAGIVISLKPATLVYTPVNHYTLAASTMAVVISLKPATPVYTPVNHYVISVSPMAINIALQAATPNYVELPTARMSDSIVVTDTPFPARNMVLSSGVGIAPTFSVAYWGGAEVIEQVRVAPSMVPTLHFGLTVFETMVLQNFLNWGYPVNLSDTVGISPVLRVAAGVAILESLIVNPTLTPTAKYGLTILEALKISPSLARFVGASLSDGIGAHDVLGTVLRAGAIISETIGIQLTGTPQLLMRVDLAEGITLTHTQVLKAIYNGTLSDALEITAAYLSPGGNLLTWVMNTRTNAVTEYQNYEFNSFATMGRKYLGSAKDGLYELDGDTDAGDDIVSRIQSGFAQFNGSKLAGFKAAYLGMRGEGDFILRLTTGDNKVYDYGVRTQDGATTKVNMGKGLRARYFAFELISDGTDFELDNIEFVPLRMDRRV